MFIYVMDEKDRDTLVNLGYTLIKSNKQETMWVFENKNDKFADVGVPCVVSDILTF